MAKGRPPITLGRLMSDPALQAPAKVARDALKGMKVPRVPALTKPAREPEPKTPAPPSPPNETRDTPGRTGRPSSMPLLAEELRRREEGGTALPGGLEEARELLAWLAAKHPDAPRPGERTVANNISIWGSSKRTEFLARKSARNPARN